LAICNELFCALPHWNQGVNVHVDCRDGEGDGNCEGEGDDKRVEREGDIGRKMEI
jgi:hypothetical protein